MPSKTVMVWNIERFGCYGRDKELAKDYCFLVLYFVTQVILHYDVDVAVIQEFRREGISLLPQLMKFLRGKGWALDYIPAGFSTELQSTAKGEPKVNSDCLNFEFQGVANNEGYLVLFKKDVLTSFSPLSAQAQKNIFSASDGSGYINLCCEAVPCNIDFSGKEMTTFSPRSASVPHYFSPAYFPCPNAFAPDKRRAITRADHAAKRRRGEDKPQDVTADITGGAYQWKSVRRPCLVKFNAGAANEVHLAVYHAPVSSLAWKYAAQLCGLIREVQDTENYPNIVVAGDFNVAYHDDPTGATLTAALANFTSAGVNPCVPASGKFEASTVHVVPASGSLPPLTPADFIGSNPRDIALARFTTAGVSLAPATSYLCPVLDGLVGSNALATSILQESTIQKFIAQSDFRLFRSNPSAAQELKKLFLKGNATNFTPETAAMFYRAFISDHLPLLITIVHP